MPAPTQLHRRLAQGTPDPMTREQAIAFCQRNYGHWSGPQIEQYLALRGRPVTGATIRLWASPARRKRQNARGAASTRDQRLFGRMSDLRDAGLSYADIARVLKLDYGIDVTEDTIARAFQAGRPTPKMSREYAGRPR